jgi:hypothetical protein
MPRAAANRLTAPMARNRVPNHGATASSRTWLSSWMKSKPLSAGMSGLRYTVA